MSDNESSRSLNSDNENFDNENSDNENSDNENSDNENSDNENSDNENSDNENSDSENSVSDASVSKNSEIKSESIDYEFKNVDISKLDFKFDKKKCDKNFEPIFLRKSFHFAFWYMKSCNKKEIEVLYQTVIESLKLLLIINNPQVYICQGSKEKDRIRVICLNSYVNNEIALDLRAMILQTLGYKINSNIIPSMMYEVPIKPKIFMPVIWDSSMDKWELKQKFKCLINKEIPTEQIEQIMWYCLLDNNTRIRQITSKYKEYMVYKSENEENSTVLSNPNITTNIVFDREISEEIKKDLKKYYNYCIDYFKNFHPDSTLRTIRKLTNDIFVFDFTKSNNTCRICNLIHKSNRQYITYSKSSKTVHYYCYDSNASGKKKLVSFQNK
jgi:hypothetical protein